MIFIYSINICSRRSMDEQTLCRSTRTPSTKGRYLNAPGRVQAQQRAPAICAGQCHRGLGRQKRVPRCAKQRDTGPNTLSRRTIDTHGRRSSHTRTAITQSSCPPGPLPARPLVRHGHKRRITRVRPSPAAGMRECTAGRGTAGGLSAPTAERQATADTSWTGRLPPNRRAPVALYLPAHSSSDESRQSAQSTRPPPWSVPNTSASVTGGRRRRAAWAPSGREPSADRVRRLARQRPRPAPRWVFHAHNAKPALTQHSQQRAAACEGRA